jgi:hypothetical protein
MRGAVGALGNGGICLGRYSVFYVKYDGLGLVFAAVFYLALEFQPF